MFTAPLTLIVGYNGSGKTTIIECLKYASTGQLPPNSKGGAFIHDPKLCGEKEVLAQVKLRFRNASKNTCIITRSLSLTVKKASMTQKTLECQLVMMNNGERVSISTRVAELDKVVPAQLGVSRAVLENVIFCHQDDSLWPMSEPLKLKVKFDEIFEAQKYTKAIDSLTKMKKAQKIELGKLVIHEANFKSLKDKADRVKRKLTALGDEIDELTVKKEDLEKGIAAAEALSKEKHEKKAAALGIVNDLNSKIQSSENLKSFLVSLKSNLEELEDSDEWLQSTLEKYEERMREYEQQEADLQQQYRDLQEDLRNSRRKAEDNQAEKGQHQAEKESYERSIQSRVELVKEAAHIHSLRGYNGDLEDHQIREFVERIQKLSREKDAELDRIRRTTNDELKQTQATLTELETKQATRTNEKVNARQAIAANEKKSKQRQLEADHILMNEGVKAALEASLQDTRSLLTKTQTDYQDGCWDSRLNDENEKLREQEQEERRLKQELFQSTKLSRDLAALEFTKKTLKEQQSALQTLISTYGEQLTAVIGPDFSPETLDRDFQNVLDQKDRTLREAKKQQDGADRELSNLEFKLKDNRSTLSAKTEEMQKCQSAVLSSITTKDGNPIESVDSYPEELKGLEEACNEVQKEIDGFAYISKYYTESQQIIKDNNCCRLCRRSFSSKQETVAAAEILKKLIDKYTGNKKKELEEELAGLNKDHRIASAARLKYDTYKKLHDVEIPALERTVKKMDGDRAVLLSKCEQFDSIVKDEEAAKRDVEALSTTVTSIANYRNDITRHEADLERLSSQQKKSGTTMTVSEIKEQSEVCDEQIHSLKTKIAKLSSGRDEAMNEINRLEREESVISNKLDSASHQLEKKQGLLATIEELRESTALHKKAIQEADVELTALGPQFAKAQTQHDDTQRRGQIKSKDVQVEKDRLSETINKFKLVEDSINAYIDGGGPGKLAACLRSIKTIEQDIERIESELLRVTAENNQVKKRRADSEHTKRSIVDNIRYRKTLRDLETLNEQIQELESHNATEDYNKFRAEALAADNHRTSLTSELGPTVGLIRAQDKELENLYAEWETDYQDAAKKYREMHVKVETTKAAIEDLGKCSGALDNAIMKYHTMKMEEINAIAGELWRSTYQGTDVDTIMIRSENENPSAKSTRRNYNYRVVMVKQDAEMDMRGRCSAGQKVLASIIIRLALAECFGINCGVIALDEPTTNLDRDNIRALAEALNKIIKARKHQANFQLIVITHDEEFLKDMKCNEFGDIYYRISRNSEQNSIIEAQSLAEIM